MKERERETGKECEQDKDCICLGCLTQRENQREGGWVKGLIYLIFYPECAEVSAYFLQK